MKVSKAKDKVFKVADEAVKREGDFAKVDAILTSLQEGQTVADKLLDGQARTAMVNAIQSQLASQMAPVGSVVAWPGPGKIPPGWRKCNGDWLKKLGHELLWTRLGEGRVYGKRVGDKEQPEFKLPDFRGYFLRGKGGEPPHRSGDLGILQPHSTARPEEDSKRERGGHGDVLTNQQETAGGFKGGSKLADVGWDRPGALLDWDNETRPANYAVHWIIRIR